MPTVTIQKILDTLNTLKATISVDDDRLVLHAAKGTISEELKAELAANKRDMIVYLQSLQTTESEAPLPDSPDRVYPLSFPQQRLWFLAQALQESVVFNLPILMDIRGPIDFSILSDCLIDLGNRHEAFRTRFVLKQGIPTQVISGKTDLRPEWIDLSLLDESAGEEQSRRIMAERIQRPFSFEHPPLAR
ncbi:MAG: hypothetical protein EHM45_13955, partial [Desulfobacteraceae bacterium]